MDCLFCKIAAGEIPSNKLFEDDQLLAFYDIDPQAPVHFLVIPKKHIDSAAALTEEDSALLGHVFAVIAKVCEELGCEKAYNLDGGQSATVVMNNEVLYHVKQRQTSDIIYFATAIPNGE